MEKKGRGNGVRCADPEYAGGSNEIKVLVGLDDLKIDSSACDPFANGGPFH